MESTDLATDPLLRLRDAAPLAGVDRTTLLRWIRGHRGVKLRAWKFPDGWRTRASALLDFGAALAALEGAETAAPSDQRGKDWTRAMLRRFGIEVQ